MSESLALGGIEYNELEKIKKIQLTYKFQKSTDLHALNAELIGSKSFPLL